MVLDPEQVIRVRELLATGQYTQRQIARSTGVSRGSVQRIQHGKRAAPEPPVPEAIEEERVSPYDLPVAKCQDCGCRCTQPCVACACRAQPSALSHRQDDPPADFGLQLAGETLSRYESVRDAKREPADG